jgi:hypothetical protein
LPDGTADGHGVQSSRASLSAVPTSFVLVILDVGRRLVLKKGLPMGVVGLWVADIAGAAVIAVLGALFGRWLYVRQERLSLTRPG